MADTVEVNFSRPMPLFPLGEVVLLPHAVQPLHVFEPRYRQMVDDALSGSGQIAMASYAPPTATSDVGSIDCPPLRPAVCVGHIVQHDQLNRGSRNILLHGVCRARIIEMHEPTGERLYRMAMLEPTERPDAHPPALPKVRRTLRTLLRRPRMEHLRCIETVREWVFKEDIPTPALVELLGFALVNDSEVKYRLLAEPDVRQRAKLVAAELTRLDHLVRRAEHQSHTSWPKGMSWN